MFITDEPYSPILFVCCAGILTSTRCAARLIIWAFNLLLFVCWAVTLNLYQYNTTYKPMVSTTPRFRLGFH